MEKHCSECNRRRPYSDFYPKETGADGLCASCKDCVLAKNRAWRKANKSDLRIKSALKRDRTREEIRARSRRYFEKNREMVLAKNRAAYYEDAERRKTRNRAWHKANAEALRPYYAEKTRRRFATIRKASPSWANPTLILAIYERCRDVSVETGVMHHVDHVIPLVSPLVCGLHVEYNLQILPATENLSKSNRFEPETY